MIIPPAVNLYSERKAIPPWPLYSRDHDKETVCRMTHIPSVRCTLNTIERKNELLCPHSESTTYLWFFVWY